MNIKPGPLLTKYATIYDIDIAEVVDFVKGYVNDPIKTGYTVFEETEAERFQVIKDYIELRIIQSTSERIRNEQTRF